MGLPNYVALPRETITLPDGQTLELRGLSRAEVLRLGVLDDQVEGEASALAWATDTPLEEARAWHAKAPFKTVQFILEELGRLSGTADTEGNGGLGKESNEA